MSITTMLCAFSPITILYVLVAFLILMFMVTVHEGGHYLAGKLLGFKINEFAIGMGPKIFSKKMKSGEDFSIRIFPLGGFCAFEGEDADGNVTGSFNSMAPWKRLITLFCGAFFNFLSAILIALIAFSAYGDYLPQITQVYEDSPNFESSVIMENDIIWSVNGKKILLYTDAFEYIKEAPDTMSMEVLRDGKIVKLENVKKGKYTAIDYKRDENGNILLDEDGNPIEEKRTEANGLGVLIGSAHVSFSFGEALTRTFPYCFHAGVYILESFGDLITGQIGIDSVGGPITTISVITQGVASGFSTILFMIILISVNLAVFNLLPIPALDGGRMVFVWLEWIFGKPVVSRETEGKIHFIGIVVLLLAVVLLDALKLFI